METITLTIDCHTLHTPQAVHAHIARALAFPSYYGGTLDALHDCLGDVLLEKKVSLVWKDTKQSRSKKALRDIRRCVLNTIAASQ